MQYDENAEKYGYEGEMTPMKCDELKAYKGNVTIPVYGTISDADVYLKEDVDKVIAEKDKEIAELEESHKMEVEQLLIKIVEMKKACKSKDDWCLHTLKRERHRKYKRCLAMAKWCEERCARYDLFQEHSGFSWRSEINFYFRWYKRWLKLAEKFKEAK